MSNWTGIKASEKEVTRWGHASRLLETQYGTITYLEWCRRERDRIGKPGKGQRILVVKMQGEFCCLSRP